MALFDLDSAGESESLVKIIDSIQVYGNHVWSCWPIPQSALEGCHCLIDWLVSHLRLSLYCLRLFAAFSNPNHF